MDPDMVRPMKADRMEADVRRRVWPSADLLGDAGEGSCGRKWLPAEGAPLLGGDYARLNGEVVETRPLMEEGC